MKSCFSLTIASLAVLVGCDQNGADGPFAYEPDPNVFEPNMVYEYAIGEMSGHDLSLVAPDVKILVESQFGTKANPKVPVDLVDLIDADVLLHGQTVYTKQCATCHGVNGGGRGPAAALLTPYPRDYRPGLFKFKSTYPDERPLIEDLAHLAKAGIPGTAMKALPELTDEDATAVANYVAYLGTRGEFERTLIEEAAYQFDVTEGDRLVPVNPTTVLPVANVADVEEPTEAAGNDSEAGTEQESPVVEVYALTQEESDQLAADLVFDISDIWLASEDLISEIEIPSYLSDDADEAEFDAAVAKGHELFKTKTAACSSCHRTEGSDKALFDSWAQEWTTRISLDPKDESALVPLIARGALPPKEVTPRKFGEEPLRGGTDPAQVFSRIRHGIDGSPMPAAPSAVSDDEVWTLVAYIQSVYEEAEAAKASTPESPAVAAR